MLNNVVIFVDIHFLSMTHMTCMHMSLEETMPQSQVGVSLISTNVILPPSSSSNTFLLGPAYICVNVTDFVRLAIESDFWNTLLLPFRFLKEALAVFRPSACVLSFSEEDEALKAPISSLLEIPVLFGAL